MRKLILLLLSGMLSTACVDKDYDLGNIDTDNIAIGDEGVAVPHPAGQGARLEGRDQKQRRQHRRDLPRSRHLVSSQLPDGKIRRPRQIAGQRRSDVRKHTVRTLREEMQASDAKLASVVDLVWGQIRRGISAASQPDGSPTSKPSRQHSKPPTATTHCQANGFADEVSALARTYLTDSARIDQLEYEVGHIDISSDIVDMLADNLDPEGTPNAGTRCSSTARSPADCPFQLLLDPRVFRPRRSRSRSESAQTRHRTTFPKRSRRRPAGRSSRASRSGFP